MANTVFPSTEVFVLNSSGQVWTQDKVNLQLFVAKLKKPWKGAFRFRERKKAGGVGILTLDSNALAQMRSGNFAAIPEDAIWLSEDDLTLYRKSVDFTAERPLEDFDVEEDEFFAFQDALKSWLKWDEGAWNTFYSRTENTGNSLTAVFSNGERLSQNQLDTLRSSNDAETVGLISGAIPADGQELKTVAANKGLAYGAALEYRYLEETPKLKARVSRELNVVTVENSLKMATVRPTRETFDFAAADKIVDWAVQKGMTVRGHTLIWHLYNPKWLETVISPATVDALMVEHIRGVISHFKERVKIWDVVNEPISSSIADQLTPSVWFQNMGGEAYIDRAFSLAREADPTAELLINEFGLESSRLKFDYHRLRRKTLLSLFARLKSRNVPVDGLGLQSHLIAGDTFDELGLRTFIEALVNDFGMVVDITEIDVSDKDLSSDIPSRDAIVGQTYFDYLKIVLKAPIRRIVGWGLADGKYNWLDGQEPRSDNLIQRSFPFDANYNRKIVHSRIREAIANTNRSALVNILSNPNYQQGTTGWNATKCTIAAVTTPVTRFGNSLAVTNREVNWGGPRQSLAVPPSSGQRYFASGWVRSATTNQSIRLTIAATRVDGSTEYQSVEATPISFDGWTYVGGEISGFAGTFQSANFYAESTAGTDGFFLSNMKLFTL